MRAQFLELTAKDRADGVDLHAQIISETDGRLVATVLRIPANPGRFGSTVPTYVCGCWPTPADRHDCSHILVVKAALDAARSAQSAPAPPAAA